MDLIKEINIELFKYQDLGSTLIGNVVLDELQKYYEKGIRINITFEGQVINTYHKDDVKDDSD